MRVVLDTNILTRALCGPRGPAAEVFRRVQPPHILVLSLPLLSELSRVLRYNRIRRIHGLNEDAINHYLRQLQSATLIVDVPPGMCSGVVPDDPRDDFVIATAVVGGAEVLCTLDRHFNNPHVVDYCTEQGIKIMSDVKLLHTVREIESRRGGSALG